MIIKRVKRLYFQIFLCTLVLLPGCGTRTEAVPAPMIVASLTPLLMPDLNIPGYEKVNDTCETYIKTTWGSGLGQWGDPEQLGRLHGMIPPLVFNAQNDLYLSDFANHRLLKYDGFNSLPVQVISLPASYFSVSELETLRMPWSMITITKNNILVPYDTNKLGILSFDGQVIKEIQLPDHFDFTAPGWRLVWVDARGGLLVKGGDGAYFDVGWENGVWHKISTRGLINPFVWNDYIGDMSSVLPTVQLYRFDPLNDFLEKPSEVIDTGLNISNFQFLGADQEGWVYLEILSESGTGFAFARFSLPDGTKQISATRNDLLQIIQASVAPNGTIYLISYDRNDSTVQPEIVRCNFPK